MRRSRVPHGTSVTRQVEAKGAVYSDWEALNALASEAARASPAPTKKARRGLRCAGCIRLKVRCTGQIPCERCFQLCVPCEVPVGARTRPYLELVLSFMDPKQLNIPYFQALYRMHLENRLDRRKMLLQMLLWRNMCIRAKLDVTYGLMDQICEALAISPIDVEDVEEIMLDRAGARGARQVSLQTSMNGLMTDRLVSSDSFRALDDGASALLVGVCTPETFVVGVNDAGAKQLSSTSESNAYLSSYNILPIHAFASLVAPEDRQIYYEMVTNIFERFPQTRTVFIKMTARDGDIELYIVHLRVIHLHEFPDAFTVVAINLERAPPSRHLTRRPGHAHHIVEAFRQGPKRELKRPAPGADTDAVNPSAGTAMACLPLPTIPDREVRKLIDAAAVRLPPFMERQRKALVPPCL